MTPQRLEEILDRARTRRLLVIGDTSWHRRLADGTLASGQCRAHCLALVE